MPNQNDPTQNPNPANQATNPTTPPVIFPQPDLPPLLPEFQNLPKNDIPATSPINPPDDKPDGPETSQPDNNGGSSTPPDISSLIPKAKKKFGGGKIIATILGLIVLIGGVGAGVLLTQQKQLIQQKASGAKGCLCPNPNPQNIPCIKSNDINYVNLGTQAGCAYCNWSWEGGACCPGGGDSCSPIASIRCVTKPQVQECKQYSSYCSKGVWQPIAYYGTVPELCADSRCRNESFCRPSTTPPTAPPTATPTASPTATPAHTPTATPTHTPTPTGTPNIPPAPFCVVVKAYDNGWNALTNAQLSALTVGDIINFCVNGNANTGTFDKAQFMVNVVLKPETIAKRPSSNDFCQPYTILSTDTTVSVRAKIHHSSGVWVGEGI
jgi:hypothetical protein